jgi:hypothetical protein
MKTIGSRNNMEVKMDGRVVMNGDLVGGLGLEQIILKFASYVTKVCY